jgi:hypothetical protein
MPNQKEFNEISGVKGSVISRATAKEKNQVKKKSGCC